MSIIFSKYPYFSLTPANVDIHHALMVNVEYVGGLHFLLRVLLRGVTNHGEERGSPLCRGVLTAWTNPGEFKCRGKFKGQSRICFFGHVALDSSERRRRDARYYLPS
ncbi:hypothetical protein AVEN_263606-1 [Araneus ventricosus]|uniref:Uncharacterized protein n=1 Tax=Araneus ventricosus TaxID=182803 RepID=A0A4Y2TJF1_ARAVE|nr:hypothetical protein AVEN_263606-1 [Araneus ventricosus]